MDWNSWEIFIRIIVCLPVVAVLAYLAIKYGLAKNYIRTKGNLRIVEQIALLPKATLNIVKAGDEYLLVSATEQNVVVIKELDNYQEKETPEFQHYLNGTLKKLTGKRGVNE